MITLWLACTPEPLDKLVHDTGLAADTASTPSTPSPTTPTPTDTGHTAVPTTDGTWRSALYPDDWAPGFADAEGRLLHDFSYAGYHRGEAPIPSAPPGVHVDVVAAGADPTGVLDSTAALQAAFDDAASRAPAVVDLPAGTFRVDGRLSLTGSDVVLKGAGSGSTFLWFSQVAGLDQSAHLTLRGAPVAGPELPLAEDGVSTESTVRLVDVGDLRPGDAVDLGWTITPEYVAEHGMTGVWTAFVDQRKTFFRRVVTAVDPATGTVTFDVPLRSEAPVRHGASVHRVTGALGEVGIEGLSLSNVGDWDAGWATDQVAVLELVSVRDGWVRDVASWEGPGSTDGRGRHLISSGIRLIDCARVTVADSRMEAPQHRGDGGNGYLFEVSRSNEILFRDDVARAGRHNFIQNWDFGTSGVVWLRTTSSEGRAFPFDREAFGYPSYSEYHHSLATANLVDASVASDGWQGVNRQSESSGAGHSVTESVFWNVDAGYLRSLQYGWGYVIGTSGAEDLHVDPSEPDLLRGGVGTAPEDWVEGRGAAATLAPQSLYEDQLRRRLGP